MSVKLFFDEIFISVAYRHRSHNKNLLIVHLIFVTEYRHRLLYGNFCDDVRGYLYDCCVSYNWYVKRTGFDGNHVHLLLQYNPTGSVSRIVSVLKQCNTWYACRNYNSFLCQFYWM